VPWTVLPLAVAAALAFAVAAAPARAQCRGTVYLTFDTGHMEPAVAIADILRRHDVKATFFLANEKTKRGDTTLDPAWAPFWKRLADDGHAFGSHTWRHWYFRGDAGPGRVSYVPPGAKQGEALDREAVCAELRKPEEAFRAMTGRGFDGLWRAPGGRTTPRVLEFAKSCGYVHVGWSAAGFSGDELPSDRYPSAKLIAKQLEDIRDGDVLLWHLGIWSRKDALWPRLDELIAGLKAKGLCFARITEGAAWKR
jgi:peptidoglycan/xylan/chitin deacetylase (PgdA/CDA1 family)